jgi:elongation of very long chain fatty acids protein 6
VACAAGYLVVIGLLVLVMRSRPAFDLKGALVLWNGLLSIASFVGALIVVPFTVHRLQHLGLTEFCCSEAWYSVQSVNVVIALFCWSKVWPKTTKCDDVAVLNLLLSSKKKKKKIPELVDTVFLALRKREIMLLHWYHHVTVLLFVWWSSHHNVGGTMSEKKFECV